MMNTLLSGKTTSGRGWLLLLWLVLTGAGTALAQTTGPAGGTLSPANTTLCAGFNSGTLTLTGYAGTIVRFQQNQGSGYVDIPNSAAASYTFSNLTLTTTFRVIVQPSAGTPVASAEATVTVNQPPAATITSNGPTAFCTRGTIYLVAGPGGTGYTYQFLRGGVDIAGATSQVYTASVTANGAYSVRVMDANGCSAISSSITVRVNANDVVSLAAGGPTTFCQGGSVLLTGTVSGSASSYTYQFTNNGANIPGATSSTYTATASGSYALVVYNPSTCSETSLPINVTVNPITVPTVTYGNSSYCKGNGSTPAPTITPAGGAFGATPAGLSLSSSTGVINLSASQPGTYTVSYTAGANCPGTSTTSVTITAPPTAGFSYAISTGCAGTTGTLAATLASGSTAGTFSASPAGLGLNASTGAINLAQSAAGTYTVTNTVAAAGGCGAVTSTATVTLTAQPVATLAAGGPTTFCQGGAVLLTAGGGNTGSTYQFLLNNQFIVGATSATYSAAASGSYSVIITNGSSCTSTSAAVAVTVNPGTSAAFSYPAAVYCQSAGSSPTPTVTGTAGGTFSAGAGLSINATTGVISLANSPAGSYTVTYSVGGSCPSSSTAGITVTAPAVATFSYGANTYCVGGAPATPILATGATAGTFAASPAGLSLNASTGAIDLTQSAAGTYTVTNTVAASGGCPAATATVNVSISLVPVPTLAANGPTTFCAGGSVLLTANGGTTGSTYQFLLNGQAISGATAATYSATVGGAYGVRITNAGTCSGSSATVTVTVNVTATPTLSYAAGSYCQGMGTATATLTGGASGGTFSATPAGLGIDANTGTISLSQSQPGTYTVTYVGGSPCPGSTTASVTILATPSAAFSYAGGATLCTSGAAATPTVAGASGGTFSATPAGLTIDPMSGVITPGSSTAGTYAVTYAVAGPCPASTTLTVTISAAPVASFSYGNAGSSCAGTTGTVAPVYMGGGSAGVFSATPAGLSLNASTGVIDLSQSTAGTYTVTNSIAAMGSCAAVLATASITINARPTAVLTAGGATTFCQGGAVLLTAAGGGSYQFLLNGQPIAGATAATYPATTAGSYSVLVTSASGCPATSAAVAVVVNPATTATFTYPSTSFCRSTTNGVTPTITGTAGGTFSAGAGLSLNATTGAIVPGSSTAGTYTVTYSVAGNCPSTGTASVTITTAPAAAFSYAAASYCATGSASAVLAGGSAAGTFAASPAGLSLNAGTGAVNLMASAVGSYTITNTVAASGGCAAAVASTTLTINAQPTQPVLTLSGSILSTPTVAGASYQFYNNGVLLPGTTGPSTLVTQNGSYTVVVTSAAGCASVASAAVAVIVTATTPAQAALALTVFPNPTPDGQLRIGLASVAGATQLTVLNSLGQVLRTATVPAGITATALDLRELATGVYMLRATTAEGTITRRFVRE